MAEEPKREIHRLTGCKVEAHSEKCFPPFLDEINEGDYDSLPSVPESPASSAMNRVTQKMKVIALLLFILPEVALGEPKSPQTSKFADRVRSIGKPRKLDIHTVDSDRTAAHVLRLELAFYKPDDPRYLRTQKRIAELEKSGWYGYPVSQSKLGLSGTEATKVVDVLLKAAAVASTKRIRVPSGITPAYGLRIIGASGQIDVMVALESNLLLSYSSDGSTEGEALDPAIGKALRKILSELQGSSKAAPEPHSQKKGASQEP